MLRPFKGEALLMSKSEYKTWQNFETLNELDIDETPHVLARIHHLMSLKGDKKKVTQLREPSEGKS